MEISLMVAASENEVIGRKGQLPWHLPDDLRFFKKTTLGKPIVMGRKTFESFGSKALPGRLNVVLSKTRTIAPEGTVLYPTLSTALRGLEKQGYPEIFIIGGGQVFAESWSMADLLYLTRVHARIDNGDAFIPPLDSADWTLVAEAFHPVDDRHAYSFTFQKWKKVRQEKKPL